jgi:hypothetical protein
MYRSGGAACRARREESRHGKPRCRQLQSTIEFHYTDDAHVAAHALRSSRGTDAERISTARLGWQGRAGTRADPIRGARLIIELNSTDEDIDVQFFLDVDAWKTVGQWSPRQVCGWDVEVSLSSAIH